MAAGRRIQCVWIGVLALLALPHHAGAQEETGSVPQAILDEWAVAYHDNLIYAGGDAGHQMYLFMPSTVRRTPKGTATFWLKLIPALDVDSTNYNSFRENYVAMIVKAGGNAADYEHYLRSMIQDEVDCVHKTMRTLQIVDYNDHGNMIRSSRLRRDEFEEPVPGSNGEYLIRVFCNPTKRMSFRDVMDGAPRK